MQPTFIGILILLALVGTPFLAAGLIRVRERRKQQEIERSLADWDAEESRARTARAIIVPATFPATAEQRAEMEAELPGYKFVDPVDDNTIDELYAKRTQDEREREEARARIAVRNHRARKVLSDLALEAGDTENIFHPNFQPQTLRDVIADAEGRN